MTEGAIIMLAHATQNVYASEFPARGTERLNCCCHRCAMHTLVTRSEIELLDTAYVCSCSTRWLTLAAVAVVFIFLFFLPLVRSLPLPEGYFVVFQLPYNGWK